MDPTVQVGTWNVSGTGDATVVSYTYKDASGTSGPFTFTVHSSDGTNLSFCAGGSEEVTATLKTGLVGC